MAFMLSMIISLVVSAAFLWIGMKAAAIYSGVPGGGSYCSFSALILVCAVSTLASLIPVVGWIAAWIALFVMLKHVTDADPAELIIMVLVSRLAAMFLAPLLIAIVVTFNV